MRRYTAACRLVHFFGACLITGHAPLPRRLARVHVSERVCTGRVLEARGGALRRLLPEIIKAGEAAPGRAIALVQQLPPANLSTLQARRMVARSMSASGRHAAWLVCASPHGVPDSSLERVAAASLCLDLSCP